MAKYITSIVTTKRGKEKKRYVHKVSEVNGIIIKSAIDIITGKKKVDKESEFVKALECVANKEPISAMEAIVKSVNKGEFTTVVHKNKKAMKDFNKGE